MFVSEPIEPEAGSFDPAAMVQGLAALPGAFRWRGKRYVITRCVRHAKQSQPEAHKAGGERYLRRQSFDVELESGETATIYVLRHVPRGASGKRRWFMYEISSSEETRPPPFPGGAGGG